ncbi:hypothetical protein MHYP_G00242600 [Metynnis hypsauchen]
MRKRNALHSATHLHPSSSLRHTHAQVDEEVLWWKNITILPWCTYTTDITTNAGGYQSEWFTSHTIAHADLWWLCGDRKLRVVLPQPWQGSCALVQVLMPFHI